MIDDVVDLFRVAPGCMMIIIMEFSFIERSAASRFYGCKAPTHDLGNLTDLFDHGMRTFQA